MRYVAEPCINVSDTSRAEVLVDEQVGGGRRAVAQVRIPPGGAAPSGSNGEQVIQGVVDLLACACSGRLWSKRPTRRARTTPSRGGSPPTPTGLDPFADVEQPRAGQRR